jgi:hypothetical protein
MSSTSIEKVLEQMKMRTVIAYEIIKHAAKIYTASFQNQYLNVPLKSLEACITKNAT